MIKNLEKSDISNMVKAYNESNAEAFGKYLSQCYEEKEMNKRITFVAYVESEVAGYVNIIYKSKYPYFREQGIPEINDLSVILKYRRNGIGKMLIDKCEKFTSDKYNCIGLGVGLYKDYGSAQRLYARNGYIPDGNGLVYNNVEVKPGHDVFVDDDLLIYLCKKIR